MAGLAFADTRSPRSLSTKFRAQRDIGLRAFILQQRAPIRGSFRVLDLGGTADYWARVGIEWLAENDIDVTCVNHVDGEFGISNLESSRVRCVVADGRALSAYADNSFDFVHSNSVIEHVGRWPDMRAFANECRRLAPAYYIQTPYFWFPVDPHFYRVPFFHWYPESIRLKLLRKMQIGWSPAQADIDRAMSLVMSSTLLDRTQFGSLFPDAKINYERLMLLPKSLIATRAAT